MKPETSKSNFMRYKNCFTELNEYFSQNVTFGGLSVTSQLISF